MKPLLQTQSLVDSLRLALEQEIIRGEIPPGAQLTEQSVAQRYSIARPTAKAAIEQLVSGGMLRRPLNKAAKVPLMTSADVRDLYFSRAVVERSVVRALADSASPATGVARRAIDRLLRAEESDVAEICDADIEYHKALVDSLDSPRMYRLHSTIIGEAHLCMAQVQVHRLLPPTRIADEHSAILDAIETHQADDAESLMDRHLSLAREQLIGYLESPDSDAPAD